MKIDIKGIFEGIKNALFVKQEVEKVAQYRIDICKQCELYSPNQRAKGLDIKRLDAFCIDCSCNMWLKTRALSASCPLGQKGSKFPNLQSKWPSVMDSDSDAEALLNTPELKKEMDEYKIKLARKQIVE